MALVKVTEDDRFAGLAERDEFGSVSDDLHLYTTTFTRCPEPSGLSGRGGLKRPRWLRICGSPTRREGDLTPRPGARCWPTRADFWADIAPALPEFRWFRWRWIRTARCSATTGGPAHGASPISRLQSP